MSSLNDKTLIFVYGTLKRNQPNHAILVERSDVTFISEGTTANKWPLIIATERNVPYLLNKQDFGKVIRNKKTSYFMLLLEC
jgi:gamma-glutamylaminecyclotransferase